MTSVWTWSGTYCGYRRGDSLFTHDGREVGHFYDDEIYGADGRYLGEVKSHNRLITHRSKRFWRQSAFTPRAGGSYARQANYVGYTMLAGHEDFPGPEAL